MRRQLLAGLLPVAGAFLLVLGGCEKNKSTTPAPNQPPTVEITGGAAEHQADDYKVEFYWFGYDPDGAIDHFDLAVDDSSFATADTTTAYSRALLFKADSLTVRTELGNFHKWHTFYVRAVDNKGARSRSAERTFNAYTIAPFTKFQEPIASGTASQFAQTVRFGWVGEDDDASSPDRKPVGYRLKLVNVVNILGPFTAVEDSLGLLHDDGTTNPRHAGYNIAWSDSILSGSAFVNTGYSAAKVDSIKKEWIQIRPSSVSGKIEQWNPVTNVWDTVTGSIDQRRFSNLTLGDKAFSVRAVDEAGAIEPNYKQHLDNDFAGNVFVFEVINYVVAPTIRLSESSLGSFTFPVKGNAVDWEVAADLELRFGWTGDANFYGGEVQAFNYGLDIPDPSSERQAPGGIGGWIGWGQWHQTINPISFPPSDDGVTHYFYIKARDTIGNTQLGIARLKVVAFIFDKKILIIDDFADQVNPTDRQHDAFFDRVLSARFDYADSSEIKWLQPAAGQAEPPTPPTLSEISRYEMIICPHNESGTNQYDFSVLGDLTSADSPSPAHYVKRRALATYVGAGGKLWVWGINVMGGLMGDDYKYPKEPDLPTGQETADPSTFDANSFIYNFLHIHRGVIQHVPVSNDNNVFFGANAYGSAVGRYPNLQIDRSRFDPRGEHPDRGLGSAESIHGASVIADGLDTLYTYVAKSPASTYNGKPTALYYRSPGETKSQGDVAYFGFYYYYLYEDQVHQLCDQVFADMFGSR
jgi:hypothetical protein